MTDARTAEEARGLSGAGRVVVWIVAIVAGLNLLFLTLERATGSAPSGPTSSSYATVPSGLAAYAELLERSGHRVSRMRTPPGERRLAPTATVFVLDAGRLEAGDTAALRRFVDEGGHLVAGGVSPDWLEDIVEDAPAWEPAAVGRARVLVPAPEVRGVGVVSAPGAGSWGDARGALPVLAGDGGRVLLAVKEQGAGRVSLLASATPLHNALLDDADNAALGLALAGPRSRDVVFVETVHGFGRAVGVGAIPARWRWVLGGMALAALVWLFGRARRLGPPEEGSRPPAPARRLYVEALAATMARTRDAAEAAAPVRRAALQRLARRAGLRPGSQVADIRAAAARFGLTDAEADALLSGAASDDDVLAAGRASAKLVRTGR